MRTLALIAAAVIGLTMAGRNWWARNYDYVVVIVCGLAVITTLLLTAAGCDWVRLGGPAGEDERPSLTMGDGNEVSITTVTVDVDGTSNTGEASQGNQEDSENTGGE